MSWRGRRVLVTGADGFIGSHLVEHLVAEGAEVRAMVWYNAFDSRGWLEGSPAAAGAEVVAGDVTDMDSVRAAMNGIEVAFHLAALIAIPFSYRAPRYYLRTNAEGTLNVLQAAREADVRRVVHTSTSEVYGTARRVPIAEDHPLQGQSPYAASKIAADKLAEAFHLSYGVPVVTVRPFNTFGPRQSARAVIPTILSQALRERPVRLGNLHPTRDLLFVSDTVDGFLRAGLTAGVEGRTINLGTGREISIADLVVLIGRVLGRELVQADDATRRRPPDSEVDRLVADAELAADLLGWRPRVTLEEGLSATVDWFRRHLDHYREDAYVL